MSDDQRTIQSGAGYQGYGAQHTEISPQSAGSYGNQGMGGGVPTGTHETVLLQRKGPVVLAWLVVVNGPHIGRIERLDPGGTVIGRDPGSSHIVIDDEAVSAPHAKVRANEVEGALEFYAQDMASANGTFVNESEIDGRQVLEDGDRIRVGVTNLVFKQIKQA